MNIMVYFSPETLSNAYIVYGDEGSSAILIDPHVFDNALFAILEERNLLVDTILLTHANSQSNHAVRTIRKIYSVNVFGCSDITEDLFITNVETLDQFSASGFIIKPIPIPGHHRDSVLYHIDSGLFTGDVISAGVLAHADGSYGRAVVAQTVREILGKLPGKTWIYPLNGPPSTLAIEQRTNKGLGFILHD